MVRTRVFAFVGVLILGVILFASLVASTYVAAVTAEVNALSPRYIDLLPAANIAQSFVLSTIVFTLVFRWMPDAKVHMKDAVIGATVTAVLYLVGKYAVALYLGRSILTSAYGAAGSVRRAPDVGVLLVPGALHRRRVHAHLGGSAWA